MATAEATATEAPDGLRTSPVPGPVGARAGEAIDTTVRLVTPERITFLYPLAGPFRRASAYLLDFLFWIVALIILGIVLSLLSIFQWNLTGLGLVIVFVLQWGYGAFFEAMFNGRTPGKAVCGLRVVTVSGTPISGTQAFLRNLTWPVEGVLTMAFLPAIASMMLTSRFQRLGDLAAGTMVIVERRPTPATIAPIQERGVMAVAERLPLHVELGPELSRALADYVARRDRFSRAQREEMTAPLARPLRRRYGLPPDILGDAVVCALYQRVFVGG